MKNKVAMALAGAVVAAGSGLAYLYWARPTFFSTRLPISLAPVPPTPTKEKFAVVNRFDNTRFARNDQELDARIAQALAKAGLQNLPHRLLIDTDPTGISQRFVDGQTIKGGYSAQVTDGAINIHVYINPQYEFANGILGLVDRSYALALMQVALSNSDQVDSSTGQKQLLDLINYLNRYNISYIKTI